MLPFLPGFFRFARAFGGFMERFDGVDFLEVDGLFKEEELAVRGLARQFVSDRLMPVIAKHHRDGTFAMELVPDMAERAVYAPRIQGYGGPGLNNVAYGRIIEE